jgi:hypothetical protein
MATEDSLDAAEVAGGEETDEVEGKGAVMEEAVDEAVGGDVVTAEGEVGSTETVTCLLYQRHKTHIAINEEGWRGGLEWSGTVGDESHRRQSLTNPVFAG